MGHNLNLVAMLGLPERVTCPKCGREVDPGFYEYDIDAGRTNPNPAPGAWNVRCHCCTCDSSWLREVNLVVEQELEAAFDLSDGACPGCGSTTALSRCHDGWCFGCMDECQGFVVTAETLAGVMEKWREAVG